MNFGNVQLEMVDQRLLSALGTTCHMDLRIPRSASQRPVHPTVNINFWVCDWRFFVFTGCEVWWSWNSAHRLVHYVSSFGFTWYISVFMEDRCQTLCSKFFDLRYLGHDPGSIRNSVLVQSCLVQRGYTMVFFYFMAWCPWKTSHEGQSIFRGYERSLELCIMLFRSKNSWSHVLQYSYVVVGSSHFFLAILSVSPESILSFYVILEHNHFVSSTKSSTVLKLLL